MKVKTLEELFIHNINDLYDAEKQLTKALPMMAESVSDPMVKEGFQAHLKQTEEQIQRLEQILESYSLKPEGITCKAMEGLLEEGKEILEMEADFDIKDAAIVGASQKVEHYEIAGYTSALMLAQKLKLNDVVKLLKQTLQEEGHMAKQLELVAEQTEAVETEV
jgi:ferritin-like metal-binding protein YciE